MPSGRSASALHGRVLRDEPAHGAMRRMCRRDSPREEGGAPGGGVTADGIAGLVPAAGIVTVAHSGYRCPASVRHRGGAFMDRCADQDEQAQKKPGPPSPGIPGTQREQQAHEF